MNRLFTVLYICLIVLATSVASADTIKLVNGYEVFGKASVHPGKPETHTIVRFKNRGWMAFANTEIKEILPNDKDQFENRSGGKG